MKIYTNILVALDFSPVAEKVIVRAKEMAEQSQAKLILVHVFEYIPPMEPVGDMLLGIDWGINEQELVELAKERFTQLAEKQEITDCERDVIVGNARTEIARYAQEQGCDLIIVGSHGRSGLARLLGSTANAVLHHAHCDVLAVRADE
ncbi:MAG: universal stress protein [Candidatus Polarisedimenticolaceae bacterium]|nr:universal stress protein [Candidatus Polarisedimenticolaceae bacterium]